MFQPKYSLSPELFLEIAQIERLYGQIEGLRLPSQLDLNLTRNNMIQSAYASNKIEGNPLTLPEVTNLLLDDRVPVNRSEKEVVNYFELLKELPRRQYEPLTIEMLTDMHRKLLTGVDETAGQIRDVAVVVGKYSGEQGTATLKVKHNPPFHTQKEISTALSELLTWANQEIQIPAVVKAGIFHHHFVYIHPFEDGNGRVCRLMTALVFMKANYQINRYFILDDYYDIDRHQYSDKLHTADSGDKSQWLLYFAEGVRHSMTSALFRLKESAKTLPVSNRPTGKEGAVLRLFETQKEVLSQDVAKLLSVTRQQAHNLLRSLVEKGLLEKKGTTKSSYYVMK